MPQRGSVSEHHNHRYWVGCGNVLLLIATNRAIYVCIDIIVIYYAIGLIFVQITIVNQNSWFNIIHSIRHLKRHYLGLIVTKPVFGVSDKASFKQVFSGTETS